ncbi:uncharacterized protein LOC121383628 [Gigantopelta aegis]|uniref:uncharacterized protein LOC121383628 n=1 Tax=Gigantopelta aegis TaxID=1735272 RepID=UPI001B889C68|nr:uncharacterized protein LOC121383628 [Gigantopelta aegis]
MVRLTTAVLLVLASVAYTYSIPGSRIFDPNNPTASATKGSQIRVGVLATQTKRTCKDVNAELVNKFKQLKNRYSEKLFGLKTFFTQMIIEDSFVDPTALVDASNICKNPMFTDAGTGNSNFDIDPQDLLFEDEAPCVVGQWSKWEGPYGFGNIRRERKILKNGCGCPPPDDLVQIIELMPFITAFSNSTSVGGFIQNCFLAGNCRNESKPRDILLILDSSGSIKNEAFEYMLKGIKLMINLFCGGFGSLKTNNRLAIVQYASRDQMVVVHRFSDNQNPDYLRQVVENMKHLYGNTCTGTALNLAANEIFRTQAGMRDYTAKDTLLITDGQYNCGLDLTKGANRLKQVSKVFALGVGIAGNPTARQEVESVVTTKNSAHIFSLNRFRDFYDMVQDLETKVTNKCVPIIN